LINNIYLCILVLIALIIYGGYEGTLNLFGYWDLRIRYYIVLRRLYRLRCEYAEYLDEPKVTFKQFVKEYEEGKKF